MENPLYIRPIVRISRQVQTVKGKKSIKVIKKNVLKVLSQQVTCNEVHFNKVKPVLQDEPSFLD